jgi:2-iminobutanoate/2-iminopropanoate deaminase
MLEKISTDKSPAAVGPYSQAVIANGLVFVSGQIPLDPASGKPVEGDIRIQTKRAMDSLGAVLSAAGSSFDLVARVDIFLADMNDFAAVNEVYASYFTGEVKPSRQCVEVSRLPKDMRIEISCIAALG